MKILTGLLALLLLVLGVFVLGNWAAIWTVTEVWLFGPRVQAPVALFILSGFAVVGTWLVLMLLVQQAGAIASLRRTAKELAAQRKLADEAEASRFTALRQHLDATLGQRGASAGAGVDGAALLDRLDRLEAGLRQALAEHDNAVTAWLGTLDDRVEQMAAGRPALPR